MRRGRRRADRRVEQRVPCAPGATPAGGPPAQAREPVHPPSGPPPRVRRPQRRAPSPDPATQRWRVSAQARRGRATRLESPPPPVHRPIEARRAPPSRGRALPRGLSRPSPCPRDTAPPRRQRRTTETPRMRAVEQRVFGLPLSCAHSSVWLLGQPPGPAALGGRPICRLAPPSETPARPGLGRSAPRGWLNGRPPGS